jgi:hydrogenase maturation protease
LSVLVIGVGNDLRGDDAAGVEVVRRLDPLSGVVVRECQGEAIDLLELWDGADAVVLVDTIRSGAAAGTIHRIDASTDSIPTALSRASSHMVSVAEAIELGRTLSRLPRRIIVFGVEGASFQAGATISDEVRAAIDRLTGMVADEAEALARDARARPSAIGWSDE